MALEVTSGARVCRYCRPRATCSISRTRCIIVRRSSASLPSSLCSEPPCSRSMISIRLPSSRHAPYSVTTLGWRSAAMTAASLPTSRRSLSPRLTTLAKCLTATGVPHHAGACVNSPEGALAQHDLVVARNITGGDQGHTGGRGHGHGRGRGVVVFFEEEVDEVDEEAAEGALEPKGEEVVEDVAGEEDAVDNDGADAIDADESASVSVDFEELTLLKESAPEGIVTVFFLMALIFLCSATFWSASALLAAGVTSAPRACSTRSGSSAPSPSLAAYV